MRQDFDIMNDYCQPSGLFCTSSQSFLKGSFMKYLGVFLLGFVFFLPSCRIDTVRVPRVVVNQPAPQPGPVIVRPQPRPRPRPRLPRLLPMNQVLPRVSANAGQHYGPVRRNRIKNALRNLRSDMLRFPNTRANQSRFIGIMRNWNRRANQMGYRVFNPFRKAQIYNGFMNSIRNVRL